MSANNKTGLFSHLKSDLPASIVVFLVALPLCLGIALASEAPLFSGIIAGIIGGIVVALISGSSLGVSGPAAGLAAIVASSIKDLGTFEIFLFAVVVAGIIQFILGVIKLGVIGYYFPSSVIKGMLAGIGIIIFLKQIPHAFGYDKVPEGAMGLDQPDGQNTFTELLNMWDFVNYGAIIITLVSLFILILWERPFMKKQSFTKLLPGSLVAVGLGVALYSIFKGIPALSLGNDHTVSINAAGSVSEFFNLFTLPDFSQWNNPDVYITAIIIAVVASIETLLCVEATDKLDPQKRVTPTNRELIAQGVGNTVSGLIGGLPITQVIVRSSANIQTGGKTKASAFFHGILLFVCVISIPNVLNMIPLASLAAILFVVGFKLAKPALFKDMYKRGWGQFLPFIVTVGIMAVTNDLLLGVGIGMAVAILQLLWNNFKVPFHFDPDSYKEGEPIKIELSEDVSFLNKASIQRTLNLIPGGAKVIVDSHKSHNIHPDILEIFDDFKVVADSKDIDVTWRGDLGKTNVNPVKRFDAIVNKKTL